MTVGCLSVQNISSACVYFNIFKPRTKRQGKYAALLKIVKYKNTKKICIAYMKQHSG